MTFKRKFPSGIFIHIICSVLKKYFNCFEYLFTRVLEKQLAPYLNNNLFTKLVKI